MTKPINILRIDSSARKSDSSSRAILDDLIDGTRANTPEITVTRRDVAEGLPFVDEAWVLANFTPEEDRTDAQRQALAMSDSLIEELEASDVILIGVPIYNFSIPASLKAWIDLISRARKTFRYTEQGPVGLLTGKKVFLAVASGGVKIDSDYDYATSYLKHALNFVGLKDITVIAADGNMSNPDVTAKAIAKARTAGENILNTLVAA